MMGWVKAVLAGVALYFTVTQLSEASERHMYWKMAREYCDKVDKPLLRIGMRRSFTEPPNGDITLDIDPDVLNISGGVLGDERDMPFGDKEFGVCFNEHTLEHLYNSRDVELATNECIRVADYAVLLAPGPNTIMGILHPDHKLRMWFTDKTIKVQRIPHVPGWKNLTFPGIGQAMVLSDEPPKIFEI